MKKLILKWLGLGHIAQSGEMVLRDSYNQAFKQLTDIDVVKLKKDVEDLSESLDNRRNEIDGIIETLQNLDNHEVISDLHKRILELENKSKVAK